MVLSTNHRKATKLLLDMDNEHHHPVCAKKKDVKLESSVDTLVFKPVYETYHYYFELYMCDGSSGR